MAESDQSHITHEYDQIKEPTHEYDQIKEPTHEYHQIKESSKQSIPHQSSDSGEQYAVSLKVVSNKTEKQQQQIPLVEYAEVDNSVNKSPQHQNLPSGYDEINESNVTANKEVSGHAYVLLYCSFVSCTNFVLYLISVVLSSNV